MTLTETKTAAKSHQKCTRWWSPELVRGCMGNANTHQLQLIINHSCDELIAWHELYTPMVLATTDVQENINSCDGL